MRTAEAAVLYAVFALGIGPLYVAAHAVVRGVAYAEIWVSFGVAAAVSAVVWALNGGRWLGVAACEKSGAAVPRRPVVAVVALGLLAQAVLIRLSVPAYDHWMAADHRFGSPESRTIFLVTLPAWAWIEEIVFRNVQVRVADKTGRLLGILVVALAFAFHHLEWNGAFTRVQGVEIGGALVGGLAFALLFEARRNLLFLWLAHVVVNLVSTLDVLAHLRGFGTAEAIGACFLGLGCGAVIVRGRRSLLDFALGLVQVPRGGAISRAKAWAPALLLGVLVPLLVLGVRALA